MVGQPVTLILLAAAAAPSSGTDCPSASAVASELARLGTAAAVAAVGTPEIQVDGASMRVVLRGLDRIVSGVREVAAPASCAERARVAAVLVSAWAGAWRTGGFADGARPGSPAPARGAAGSAAPPTAGHSGPDRPQPAPAPVMASLVAATRAAPAGQPARPFFVELGGFGFGIHDGDAGAFGGGAQAGFRFSHWFGIDAVFAVGGERERARVRGAAAYRLYGLGVGLNIRKQLGRVLGDLDLLPSTSTCLQPLHVPRLHVLDVG